VLCSLFFVLWIIPFDISSDSIRNWIGAADSFATLESEMNKKKKETGRDRLKKVALWQWGIIVISAGVFANVSMMMMESEAATEAQRRGQALGRGVASLLFIGIGIGLIIAHFVRKKKS
jgi:hypothetical protein